MNLGDGYVERKDYSAAITSYEHAADLSPKNAYIRTSLGRVLLLSGREELAASQLKYALKLDSDSEITRHYLIIALTKLGRLEEASTFVPHVSKQ